MPRQPEPKAAYSQHDTAPESRLRERIRELQAAVAGLRTDLAAAHKQADTYRQYQKKYHHLMTYAPTGIYEIDFEKGQIVMANSAICEYTGYSQEELLGKNPIDLLTPHSREAFSARMQQLLTGKKIPETVEFEIEAKDGRHCWASFNTQYRYQDGRLKSAFVVAHDITERKHMETALRESERRFRDMAEMLPQTLFEIDLEGNVAFLNQHAYSQFGLAPEDLQGGFNGFQMIAPEDRERALKNFSRVLAGERIGLSEYKLLRRDKSTYPALLQSSVIHHNGKKVGVRGFIIDVSDKKALEEELRRVYKMEAVGTLAGGIAHEFNNILSIIMGNTEISLDDLEPTHEISNNLMEIMKACQRGKSVVKQLLDFSKKVDAHMELIHMGSVIQETLGLLRASIPSSITIQENCAPDLYPIMADETQLNQLLINLCNNAAQAMRGDGGVLTISAENRWVGDGRRPPLPELKAGPYVCLRVSDTGHGIPAELMEKIFDPYFTTREIGEGTGLGLSVVQRIANNHKGIINVRSSVGRETCFEVFLPARPQATVSPHRQSADILGGSERILIVDDEPALINIYKTMLSGMGYQVRAHTDPLAALDCFESAPREVDLLITDMAMPAMTGEKLVAKVRALRPDLPVILCTGFSETVGPEKARTIGVQGYLMKPIRKAEMARMIRKVLHDADSPADP